MNPKLLNHYKSLGYHVPNKKHLKTPEQIDGIRKASKLVKKTLDMLEDKILAGITTHQINDWVHDYTLAHNAIPAPLNYKGFPKSICVSVNNVICHGIPDDRVLKDGDILNVDITSILNGYFGDSSRMYCIGNVSDKAKKLVDVTKECLHLGIKEVLPMHDLNNIGRIIDRHASENGFSVVRDYCGHGIGTEFHEKPEVVHYKERKKGWLLLPGMVFTIEPMINEGGWQSKVLADKWTAVTKDNSLSAQWEHTVLVTESGVEILTD